MGNSANQAINMRVLIMTPHGRDAGLAEQALSCSGLATHVCISLEELRSEIERGAGCVLVAEEALPKQVDHASWLGPNPADWSQLPLIVLLGRNAPRLRIPSLRALEIRPNVSFLERPVSKRTLISTLRAALEARKLQYGIRAALEELESASRKKDEFLATLSHELRNPLASIRNAVYVFKRFKDVAAGSDAKTRSLVSMMERQIDHLVHLVDDLLEISRITAGKIVLKKRREHLLDIVRQAIEISEPLIMAREHHLDVKFYDDPLVDCDAVRLVQVISNLLNNAAKYNHLRGQICLIVRMEGGEAVVSVRDSGIGISPEMLPKVFDLFSQSGTEEEGMQGGLGIGLALAQRLVALHGGQIEAHSDGINLGAEFLVRLPLSEASGQNVAVAIDAARISMDHEATSRIFPLASVLTRS